MFRCLWLTSVNESCRAICSPPPHTPTPCPFKANFGSFLCPEHHPRCLSLAIRAACLQPIEAGVGGGWVLVPMAAAKSESCSGALKSFPLEVNSTEIKLWYNWIHMVWKSACKLAPPSGRRLFEPCIYDQ